MVLFVSSPAPGGVRAPAVTVLGPESVQVSWEEPAFSNGEIQSYTIRMPDPRIYLTETNLTSYIVYNLVPYTDYSGGLESCLILGFIRIKVMAQEFCNRKILHKLINKFNSKYTCIVSHQSLNQYFIFI